MFLDQCDKLLLFPGYGSTSIELVDFTLTVVVMVGYNYLLIETFVLSFGHSQAQEWTHRSCKCNYMNANRKKRTLIKQPKSIVWHEVQEMKLATECCVFNHRPKIVCDVVMSILT